MIKSMTGYGTGSIKLPSSNLNLELKSLNSRNLDIRFSGVSLGAELEEKIRLILFSRLQRGSIKVFIDFDKNTKDKAVFFDEDNFKSILHVLLKIEKKYIENKQSNILMQ